MSLSRMKHSKVLFIGSILLSILAHLGELHFFQRQSLWFSTPQLKNQGHNLISSEEKKTKSEILKEAFLLTKMNRSSNEKRAESLSSSAQPLNLEQIFAKTDLGLSSPVHLQHSLCKKTYAPIPNSLPKISLIANHPQLLGKWMQEFAVELPFLSKEFLPDHPIDKAPIEENHPSLLPIATHIMQEAPLRVEPLERSLKRKEVEDLSSYISGKSISSKIAVPMMPPFPKIPSLSELQTDSHSRFFDTEMVVYEQEDHSYIFALTLIPKSNFKKSCLKQNYIFLIDRSNSIQGERLNATKSAVRKAVEEIDANDRFNIIAFDQKIDKFSSSFTSPSSESIAKMQKFLGKIELGSFFSQSNLSKPLFLTIPQRMDEDEVYTAILITDGEGLSHVEAQKDLIEDWTRMNQGKVTLYTLAMNDDSHLEPLETLSALNRGKIFSSLTKRGLKRKLLKIMKSTQAPIAKNLFCSAVAASHENIELFPQDNLLPYLYEKEPYVILGRAVNLEDFTIFLQGRLNGERLHIKKNISFAQAKKGSNALLTQWDQQKAYSLYHHYLYNQDHRFLAEAEHLLKNHR